jgi:hypothetical protein
VDLNFHMGVATSVWHPRSLIQMEFTLNPSSDFGTIGKLLPTLETK